MNTKKDLIVIRSPERENLIWVAGELENREWIDWVELRAPDKLLVKFKDKLSDEEAHFETSLILNESKNLSCTFYKSNAPKAYKEDHFHTVSSSGTISEISNLKSVLSNIEGISSIKTSPSLEIEIGIPRDKDEKKLLKKVCQVIEERNLNYYSTGSSLDEISF